MKLAILHYKNGNIVSLVAFPAGAPMPELPAGPGQVVTELDAPETMSGLQPRDIASKLKHLAENFCIDVAGSERKLVSRT
ncbi:hypothetical protein [Bradyrhizobium sp. UNPF46]|uniref:hypothetical protein n=1 Tax=Bradyrhizobium sp. UNPF46 TaxID=1141168 RepID=UPI00115475C7|nr:hypothetical protein [Bradyrhizobium sp. UNPF46]